MNMSRLTWSSTGELRQQRTSLKFTRFADDVLPMFVAEQDFAAAPAIRQRLHEAIDASDFGYLDGPGELAPAFATYVKDHWGWDLREDWIHITTDVSSAVVEGFRLVNPKNFAVSTPAYPGFFEMLEEFEGEVVEVPLHADGSYDFELLEQAFEQVDAYLLCNPHNPHGYVASKDELTQLSQLAVKHNVFIISDEIHAPLTHHGVDFVPFAPVAQATGARAFVTCSASKGWNLAGTKCAVLVATSMETNELLHKLPPEVVTRVSILGLIASITAFRDATDWIDAAITQIESNIELFTQLVTEKFPAARLVLPKAGYLVWADFSAYAKNPWQTLYQNGRVAFGDGAGFGAAGAGFVRVNLACAPETIYEAVRRIEKALV